MIWGGNPLFSETSIYDHVGIFHCYVSLPEGTLIFLFFSDRIGTLNPLRSGRFWITSLRYANLRILPYADQEFFCLWQGVRCRESPRWPGWCRDDTFIQLWGQKTSYYQQGEMTPLFFASERTLRRYTHLFLACFGHLEGGFIPSRGPRCKQKRMTKLQQKRSE